MRKFFNNKSAFTLTELVVSMGITGVLIVSTIYLVDLANKSSTNDDLAVARQTIEELMGNRKICESTLAIQPLPLLGKTPIPVIKNASTNLLESSGVDAHIKDATQGTTLAARITAENALTSSHAKFGKRVMVGEMYVKDLGAVTDGEEGAKGEIKSTTALRLLEFSVLLAVKNSQEKAGNKVKGYTKKVIFTGVVDTTVNPMVIQSCAADVSFGKKEAERALCEDMGGLTAWDSAKGICKKEEVQRAVAKKAVAVICASDTGIGGNLDSSGTKCSPPYWGKNCHFCGTNFWVKKIGPQGEVTCTNGSNDCFSNQCMLVDKSGTAKASTCTGADPEFGGTPSTHGDCSPAQTGYKLVAGTCLPSCKKRAALQGISTANYKLIAATQCRDALYGGIEWDDFTDSVKTYDTQGTDMVCCAKQGIAHTPPSCTNTCPPGETRGPYPGCVCSVGSPPPTCTNTCPPGQTPNPSRGCRCMRPYCNARLRLFWETTPCGIDKRLLLRAQVSGVAHYCCAPLLCVEDPWGSGNYVFKNFIYEHVYRFQQPRPNMRVMDSWCCNPMSIQRCEKYYYQQKRCCLKCVGSNINCNSGNTSPHGYTLSNMCSWTDPGNPIYKPSMNHWKRLPESQCGW